MHILICEDNLIVAMDLEMTIEDLGHASAGISSTAAGCRKRCREEQPDLVLIDLDLADGATGLDLVEDLADQGIPSMIVSGQSSTVGTTRAIDILDKPLKVEHLRKALRRLPEKV